MTREEIEAALLWYAHDDGSPLSSGILHLNALACAYFEYRAERQRRIEETAEAIEAARVELDCIASPEARKAAMKRIIARCLDGETT